MDIFSLKEVEKQFNRRLKQKINPTRKSPRKYIVIKSEP